MVFLDSLENYIDRPEKQKVRKMFKLFFRNPPFRKISVHAIVHEAKSEYKVFDIIVCFFQFRRKRRRDYERFGFSREKNNFLNIIFYGIFGHRLKCSKISELQSTLLESNWCQILDLRPNFGNYFCYISLIQRFRPPFLAGSSKKTF